MKRKILSVDFIRAEIDFSNNNLYAEFGVSLDTGGIIFYTGEEKALFSALSSRGTQINLYYDMDPIMLDNILKVIEEGFNSMLKKGEKIPIVPNKEFVSYLEMFYPQIVQEIPLLQERKRILSERIKEVKRKPKYVVYIREDIVGAGDLSIFGYKFDERIKKRTFRNSKKIDTELKEILSIKKDIFGNYSYVSDVIRNLYYTKLMDTCGYVSCAITKNYYKSYSLLLVVPKLLDKMIKRGIKRLSVSIFGKIHLSSDCVFMTLRVPMFSSDDYDVFFYFSPDGRISDRYFYGIYVEDLEEILSVIDKSEKIDSEFYESVSKMLEKRRFFL